jgi:N utilization substance protein B
MPASNRRRARTAILQALYEADTSDHAAKDALEHIIRAEHLGAESASFARDLIDEVLSKQDETDRLIAEAAPAWPVEQLAPVDRNVLRLAIRELLRDNGAPVRVVVNEAVELAKRFGSENSARFVHGVLGSIIRQHLDSRQDEPVAGRG